MMTMLLSLKSAIKVAVLISFISTPVTGLMTATYIHNTTMVSQ